MTQYRGRLQFARSASRAGTGRKAESAVRHARAKRHQLFQCCRFPPRARRSPPGVREAGFLDSRWMDERKDEVEVESVVEQNVRLTEREIEVLRLIARGRTYSRAAIELGMSAHTVGTHIKNAYRKLDVHSAAAAVMQAVRLGLIL